MAQGLDQNSLPDSSRLVLKRMFSATAEAEGDYVESLSEEYHKYKREYVDHLCFNPDKEDLSKFFLNFFHFFPATELKHASLEAVHIYFDTATYDEIERDEKVTLKAAIKAHDQYQIC